MSDSTAGFTLVPTWMFMSEDVTAHMILVYGALGTLIDRDGAAWPSTKGLAMIAKISGSAVRSALRDLEAMGLVETVVRDVDEYGRKSNMYRLYFGRRAVA